MNFRSYRSALPKSLFCVSDSMVCLLKTVQFSSVLQHSVFMKAEVDISNVMSDLESHKNDFSILNYEFSKYGVCCRIFCITCSTAAFFLFQWPSLLKLTST